MTTVAAPCLFPRQCLNKGLPLFHEDFSTTLVTLRVITITKSDYDTYITDQDDSNSGNRVRHGCGA